MDRRRFLHLGVGGVACADDYWEVLPLEDLRREEALFVTHLNGTPVTASHGAPLWMIVPWLYGYKGAKAVTALSFTDFGGPGYWSTEGRFPSDGAHQARR